MKLLYLILPILLFSCSQAKKIAKAIDTLDKNRLEAAKYCAEKFPVKDTTVYLPGEVKTDTLYQLQEVIIPVECPPSEKDTLIQWKIKNNIQTVTKTKVDTVRVVKENTAKYEAEKMMKENAEKEGKEWRGKAENRGNLNWWLIVALVGCGVWMTRKLWLKLFT